MVQGKKNVAELLGLRDKAETAIVESAHFGAPVHVRRMRAADWDEWEILRGREIAGSSPHSIVFGMRAITAFCTLCDADGNRLFTKPDELKQLSELPGKALDQVFEAADKLNSISNGSAANPEKN